MKDYLIEIIIISITVGLLELIAPDSVSTKKYTKIIGSLVVLCVIITPIGKLVNILDGNLLSQIKDSIILDSEFEKNDYSEILSEYLYEHSLQEYKSKIAEILDDEFDIPEHEQEITVFTSKNENGITVNKIQILLSGKSIFKNPYEIEARISELTKSKCLVLIKEK